MPWEDLESDIAEEFSDTGRLGWVESGFRFFQRTKRAPAIRPSRGTRKARGFRSWEAAWRRGWRARRRFLALLEGRKPWRCKGYGCCNLLNPAPRQGGPQAYCSGRCQKRVAPTAKKCAAPGCDNTFTAYARQTTCSNACRQRAWYARKRATSRR